MTKKNSTILVLLLIAVVTIAATKKKKTKAGPLILTLDPGEYLPDYYNEYQD